MVNISGGFIDKILTTEGGGFVMKIFNIMKYFNSNKPKNILLADDDLNALKLEKAFFQRKGFKVFTVTSGKGALTVCNQEKIDLLMLALYMPVMNGDEVCRKIRSDNQRRNISLIMVLPSSNPEDEAICRKSGANEFIILAIR
jgi:CheY-like chemotaxis protein